MTDSTDDVDWYGGPGCDYDLNNDEVICPECTHQFHAIPVNVQRDLRECVGLLKRCAFYVRGDDPVFGAEIDALLSRLQAPTPKEGT